MCLTNTVKVKNNDSIVRDLKSNAIVNVDSNAYQQHLKKKKLFEESLSDKKRIDRLENLVESLLKTIEEMKK